MSVAFSPNGELLAAASYGGYIVLWEARTGKLVRRLRLSDQGYLADHIAFSADGRLVVAGTMGIIRLWEVATGQLVRRVPRSTDNREARPASMFFSRW